MKLADKIAWRLMSWCNGGGEIVIPNYYLGNYECDVFRVTKSLLTYEYEIKITRSDFLKDFGKSKSYSYKKEWDSKKHDQISQGQRTNRFFFVVPRGLVKVEEIPKYCGLIYFDEHEDIRSGRLEIIKSAPLIHKNTYDTKNLARSLWYREMNIRSKIHMHKADMKRISDIEKRANQFEDFMDVAYTLNSVLMDDSCGMLRMASNDHKLKKLFPEAHKKITELYLTKKNT